ncbi:MAG: polysaccharide biosynthesis tyrosine autokinase [Bacteroidota bacterium]
MRLNREESEQNFSRTNGNDIDWYKLWVVIKQNVIWLGVILILSLTASYLVVRYTKPLYQSYSEIKLGREDQSNILNLGEIEQTNSYALLSSEMELITSRLFFNKIIESVRLNPQYYTYGQFLNDEKYKNPPFQVDYQLKNAALYNKNLDLTIIDSIKYELSYFVDDQEFREEHEFNKPYNNDDMELMVTLSPNWNRSMGTKFYFRINSHDALVNYLENNLNVEPVNLDANIFKVSFQDHNLLKAHALISAIDTLYYKYSLDEKNRANKNKIEYLNSQLTETEKKLDDYEKYFEDVTITNRTVSLDEDVRRTVNLINRIDSQLVQFNNKFTDLSNLTKRIKSEQVITIPQLNDKYPNHIISLINELNLLIKEREKLGLSYRENTYTYRTRQKEIDLLKADLLAQIENSKLYLVDDIKFLEIQKLQLNQQLNKLPSKNTEYNKVKRFYALYEEIYLLLMQSKNEFEIAIAGSTTKIKILSPATMPDTPVKPNKLIVYGIGLILSFVLSFLFLVIRYLAHNKVNNVADVERNTSATLLGSVPRYKALGKHAKIIVDNQPKSALSESMRSIRTNMEFMLPDLENKIYSFTSTIGSEGKTFVSTNLGALLAMAGKQVIILDLDLRRPKVHKAFGHEANDCGMSTLLINKHTLDNCITHSDVKGLDYIGAGPVPPNPSELLLRDTFDDILSQLKKSYQIILLDTPPVGIVTDGLLAMQKADLPIYILRADYSKNSFIQNINRLLTTNRYPNLSIILNNVSTSRTGYGYSYGDVYANSNYYQE